MSTVTLRAFSDEAAAKAYFNNKVVESALVDGVMLKTAGQIMFRKDNGDYQDLTGGDDSFLVVSYKRGTGVSIDSAPAPAAEEPAAEEEEEEEDPSA